MRIGLDYRPATIAPQSGIGRQVKALEQALGAHDGTELRLFSEAPLDHPQRQSACCPPWASPLHGLQRPQVRLRFERGFLPGQLREQRIDLYIATANMGLPLGRKPAGCRYVLVLHDLFQMTQRNAHGSRLKALAYRAIDSLSIAWSVWIADRVWCPSQFSCNEAARLFPWAKAKFRVLSNWVPQATPVTSTAPPGTPARYWLVVGSREPRKNVGFFLQQWQHCRQADSEIPELVIVGQPEDVEPHLRQLAGLHWLHGLSEEHLQALYSHAECLWQPSYAEGFGLPVVEALSHGTPVAVATGSALDEVAPASARRFAPHDSQQLQAALREVAHDTDDTDHEPLRAWAQQFAMPAYRLRLNALISELEH
ncbi:glycosyltransferase family 4 protein [Pseudomonas sp. nanlin1]|uniref:glycosyltransferase family 4 protein n=1 Tax=Pseudomonas sp. nanlin1 TaxID=3040605 RepID=UPI0038905461